MREGDELTDRVDIIGKLLEELNTLSSTVLGLSQRIDALSDTLRVLAQNFELVRSAQAEHGVALETVQRMFRKQNSDSFTPIPYKP